MSDKIEYLKIDQIPSFFDIPMIDFKQSELYTKISNGLFESILMDNNLHTISVLEYFHITFNIENNKVKITRKDSILYLIWSYYYEVTENEEKSKDIINQINDLYFSHKNKNLFDFLCFNILSILENKYQCNVYIINKIARVSNIHQYMLRDQNEIWWNYWIIILNFNNIIFDIYKWTKAPYCDNNFYHLWHKEEEIIYQIRTPEYDLDNMKIKFDNDGIKEILMDGKEYELSRYHELEENIKHWEIWKKKYNWKTQYITIKNQVIKLDKKSWNQ